MVILILTVYNGLCGFRYDYVCLKVSAFTKQYTNTLSNQKTWKSQKLRPSPTIANSRRHVDHDPPPFILYHGDTIASLIPTITLFGAPIRKREHIRYANPSIRAYVNMSTMTTPGPPDRNHFADDPMHGTIAVHISHVRLSIAQKATLILHKIMNKIRDIDHTAIYHDILGQPVSLEQFLVDKDAFDTAFGTIVPKGRNSQVIVGLTIHSTKTFGTIKNAIMPTLKKTKIPIVIMLP
jgi:hypothetical protein